MNLKALAESDLRSILGNSSGGFGDFVVLTSPAGESISLSSFDGDISSLLDPETGLMVSGRRVTVSVPLRDIVESGVGMPFGVYSASSKPWVVDMQDSLGQSHKLKVMRADPDRTIGVLVLALEEYRT